LTAGDIVIFAALDAHLLKRLASKTRDSFRTFKNPNSRAQKPALAVGGKHSVRVRIPGAATRD
jgi:hypothetical protein